MLGDGRMNACAGFKTPLPSRALFCELLLPLLPPVLLPLLLFLPIRLGGKWAETQSPERCGGCFSLSLCWCRVKVALLQGLSLIWEGLGA